LGHGLSSLEAARNRALNGTPGNAAEAGQRDGTGGTMSEAKRAQGTGRLRIRGTLRVTGADYLKTPGMNIRRVSNLVTGRRRLCMPPWGSRGGGFPDGRSVAPAEMCMR
jgi:hypothetical protein